MKIKLILGASILLLVSGQINAALIERDWQTTGDGLITYDASTGLEWLDLTATADMTYNEVTSQLGVGGGFEGWHYASTSHVSALWDPFGGSSIYDGWSTANNNLFSEIASLDG